MADLDKLEAKYRSAQKTFKGNKSQKNHDAYRKAKLAFTDERVKQRKAEEADPNHPRGGNPNDPSDVGLVHVTNEEN